MLNGPYYQLQGMSTSGNITLSGNSSFNFQGKLIHRSPVQNLKSYFHSGKPFEGTLDKKKYTFRYDWNGSPYYEVSGMGFILVGAYKFDGWCFAEEREWKHLG